jgi:transcription initiation factor TFIIB
VFYLTQTVESVSSKSCPECGSKDIIEDKARGELVCAVCGISFKEEDAEYVFSCPECGSTDIYEDEARGEKICKECGIVIEERAIDLGPEYRVFDDNKDVIRTGLPPSLRFADKGLSTKVSRGWRDARGKKLSPTALRSSKRLQWAQRNSRGSTLQKNLNNAVPQLERYKTQLEFGKEIFNDALGLYRKVVESGYVRGRSIDEVSLACVYIAMRNKDFPITLEEMSWKTKVDKRKVSKYFREIVQEMKIKIKPVYPHIFVPRYCNDAHIAPEIERQAVNLLTKVPMGKIVGKDPNSIAVSAIYLASLMSEEHSITQRELCNVSTVNELTIGKNYKYLAENLEINIDAL